jgi:thiamine-phosphate pyrophosphorylase
LLYSLKALTDSLLYGILDLGYVPFSEAVAIADSMIAGGVDVLQIRAKSSAVETIQKLAVEIHPRTSAAGVPLIINDHPELAIFADGVHVGQDDVTIAAARERTAAEAAPIARQMIVGKSTHSLAQAVAAAREGADYIGFGPLFATPTKPDYTPIGVDEIRQVYKLVSIPIFCIGGIKLENLDTVLAAGARRVVIVSGILQAADIASYCREVKQLLNANLSAIRNPHSAI